MTIFRAWRDRIATQFNERKTAAAASLLLHLHGNGGRMQFIRLIKLLYLADRDAWARYGRPITGDSYYAMKQGPVLSETYNLIKAQGTQPGPWANKIEPSPGHSVKLVGEPDLGPLSNAEVAILEETHGRFRNVPTWGPTGLIKRLHRMLPEWKDPGSSSEEIDPEDILKAVGRGDQIKAIKKDLEDFAAFRRSIGAH
jgi:hypothetical protein